MKKNIDHNKDILHVDHAKLFYVFAAEKKDI